MYPSFTLVPVVYPPGLKSALPQRFRITSVPRSLIGGSYTVGSEVQAVTVGGRMLLCFGSTGLAGSICLDTLDGTVVQHSRLGHSRPRLVNSTLGAFSDCVRQVIGCFPFYHRGSDLESRRVANERVATAIRLVDPPALAEQDTFWSTFIADVEIGDYATEDVLDA
jgi:hypothetical protein